MNTEIENLEPQTGSKRRRGQVARLPKVLRDKVNTMLDDGYEYKAIIAELEKSTNPPLPHVVSEDAITRWKDGGYQDYLRNQIWADTVRQTQEKVLGAAAEDPMKFADAGVQLAATGICELLAELSRLQSSDEKVSDRYARIANSMARLAKTILSYEQHRQALAQEKAAEPKQLDPKRELEEDEHLVIVDRVNRLFGLRQYRNPAIDMFGAPAVAQPIKPLTETKLEPPTPAIAETNPQPITEAAVAIPTLNDEQPDELPYNWQQLSPEYLEEWKKQRNRSC